MIDTLLKKNDKYERNKNKLASLYGVTREHAGCYLCNYEDEYICHKFKGGCKHASYCKYMRENESILKIKF